MGNSISNYTFTVISDGPVPLASSFDTFNYTPVIMAVVLMIALVGVILYTVWFYSKSLRFTNYGDMSFKDVVREFYIHPFRLEEARQELDHDMLNRNIA